MRRISQRLAEQEFGRSGIAQRERVRKYQRTAHRINSGSVCRHLKIAGWVVFFIISSGYLPAAANVVTQLQQDHHGRGGGEERFQARYRRGKVRFCSRGEPWVRAWDGLRAGVRTGTWAVLMKGMTSKRLCRICF